MKTILTFFLLAVIATECCAAANPETYTLKADKRLGELNSIIASVNGEAISLHDILPYTRQKEYVAYASHQAKELEAVIAEIRKSAVDDIIDRKLIIADYYAQNFRIPAQDIDSEIDKIAVNMGARSRSDFFDKLRASDMDYVKMRREVEEYMAIQVMLHRCSLAGNAVTPEDLHNYFKKNRSEFNQPETVTLAMILVKDKKTAEYISRELEADPARFSALAIEYSDGPGKENGGELGEIEISKLRKEFSQAMTKIETGKIYGPITTPEGKTILKVIKYSPGVTGDYFSVLPELRQKLENMRRSANYEKYKLSLREKAVVRYFFPNGQEVKQDK